MKRMKSNNEDTYYTKLDSSNRLLENEKATFKI